MSVAVLLALALVARLAPRDLVLEERARLAVPFVVSAWDVARDPGHAALVLVGDDGRVVRWSGGKEGFPAEPDDALRLDDPAHALVALGPLRDGERAALVLVGPGGVTAYPASGAGFAAEPLALAPRARFTLRTERPRLSPFLADFDRDGRADVVLPGLEVLELWRQEDGEGAPRLARRARVRAETRSSADASAGSLSDDLDAGIVIPALSFRDLNGDGRGDLVAREGARQAFTLQRADGSFPAEPDSAIDLSIFRDTTPEARVEPGRTLVVDDEARLQDGDVDGDGILDWVVSHRRKVWVFRGTAEAPRFDAPSAILKTAEDITALLVFDVDADGRSDLVVLKLVVPSFGAFVLGLVSSLEVRLDLVGYENDGARGFHTKPRWRRELVLRLPKLLDLMRRPEETIARFEEAGQSFRDAVEGDFDGDGTPDVALVAPEDGRLDVWLGAGGQERAAEGESAAHELRRLMTGEGRDEWDLERVLAWLRAAGERRSALLTGARAPDATLRLDAGAPIVATRAADLDGDGRDELCVCRQDERRRTAFVVVGLR